MTTKQKFQLVIVSVILPLAYILLSLTPISFELFVNNDSSYYYLFFGAVIFLHWISLWIVSRFLKAENKSFKDIGYKVTKRGTLKFIVVYFLIAFGIYGGLEYFLTSTTIDYDSFNKITAFLPKTSEHRLFFILCVFTAGFCEEIIYRGYLITKLTNLGLNKWLALIPAGISFAFIHGHIAFSNFWFYFIPALIFGVIFVLSKRLLPGIILHLVHNFFGILAVMQFVN